MQELKKKIQFYSTRSSVSTIIFFIFFLYFSLLRIKLFFILKKNIRKIEKNIEKILLKNTGFRKLKTYCGVDEEGEGVWILY